MAASYSRAGRAGPIREAGEEDGQEEQGGVPAGGGD